MESVGMFMTCLRNKFRTSSFSGPLVIAMKSKT